MSGRRRGNGEVTLLKRADRRWAAAIVLDDYSRKWIYGKTRRGIQPPDEDSAGHRGRVARDQRTNHRRRVISAVGGCGKAPHASDDLGGYEHLVRMQRSQIPCRRINI
jgi:hypothetical protein